MVAHCAAGGKGGVAAFGRRHDLNAMDEELDAIVAGAGVAVSPGAARPA